MAFKMPEPIRPPSPNVPSAPGSANIQPSMPDLDQALSGLDAGAGGHFSHNIMHFARTLRAAGLPVGPGRVLDALRAVQTVGMVRRDDLYWTLHSVFVNRQDQKELFDQCFHIFWRDPKLLERMMQMLMPTLEPDQPAPKEDEASRRVADAFGPEKLPGQGDDLDADEQEIELDATLTFSDNETLQTKDFEQMSSDELDQARRRIGLMRLPILDVPTRRFAIDSRGPKIDLRKTLRQSLRGGGAVIDLARKRRVRRHPPLVILCDISGSMSRYSRMLLLFMHALTNDRDRVHSFLFGTRLTNITRNLRHRDIDIALDKTGAQVVDWSGGTRIGHCLRDFNANWSRRVLGQGALVLLITDGLDRDAGDGLEGEMERLHKSCRRLIWLNPLLRFEGFEPIATGARAMIRHIDDFRPVHNLESLEALTTVLSHDPGHKAQAMSGWIKASVREHAA